MDSERDQRAELMRLRALLGIWNHRRICHFLGIDRRTLARWESGRHRIPRMALIALAVGAAGELDAIADTHGAWAGWRIIRDQLVSPENVVFTPGDLRALPYLWALLAEFRRQRREAADAEIPGLGTEFSNVVPFRRREDPLG